MKYSRARRKQYAKLVLVALARLELKYQKKIAAEIARAGKEYAAASESRFKTITKQHKANLLEISDALARETAEKFALVPWDGVKAAIPGFDTELAQRVYDKVAKSAAKRVVDISETTESQVRGVLASGMATDIGSVRIARNIVARTGGLIGRARAATISRTEVHSAANMAQFEMASEVGVSLKREWIAGNDDRVRDDHANADGQIVGPDEPFTVMGESLMYPGDPSGSPSNIINCRCVVAFISE